MADITALTNQSSTTDGATALAGIKTAVTNVNNGKADLASPTFTGTVTIPAIVLSSETASTIASFDASKNIKSLALITYPSLTELTYVKGVTSALQTQINGKAATLSGTQNEIAYFSSASAIGSLAVATYPSLTELSYLKGVTSAIQAQFNAIVHTCTNGTTTKNANDASGIQNIAHGLGTTPKKIKITALPQNSGTSSFVMAITVYNGTTQSSVSIYTPPNNTASSTTFALNSTSAGGSPDQTGVVTWDATNIIITWTKTGSPTGVYNLLWEAEI